MQPLRRRDSERAPERAPVSHTRVRAKHSLAPAPISSVRPALPQPRRPLTDEDAFGVLAGVALVVAILVAVAILFTD